MPIKLTPELLKQLNQEEETKDELARLREELTAAKAETQKARTELIKEKAETERRKRERAETPKTKPEPIGWGLWLALALNVAALLALSIAFLCMP